MHLLEEGKTTPTFHEIRSLATRLYADQCGLEFGQALLDQKSAKMTQLYRDTRGSEWIEVDNELAPFPCSVQSE